jgi:hypothetical protein
LKQHFDRHGWALFPMNYGGRPAIRCTHPGESEIIAMADTYSAAAARAALFLAEKPNA